MKQKIWGMFLFIVTVLTCMLSVYLYVTRDKTAPVITVGEVTLEYGLETTDEQLLTLASASDNADQKVGQRLAVTAKQLSSDERTVSVTFAASDRQGNTGVATVNLPIQDGTDVKILKQKLQNTAAVEATTQPQPQEGEKQPEQSGSARSGEQSSSGEKSTEQSQSEKTVSVITSDQKQQQSKAGEGQPQLTLSATEVKVPIGQEVNLLSYVTDATDDTDSKDSLFTAIQIDPLTLDTSTAAKVDVSYRVKDSSGLFSEPVVITFIVQ